MMSPDLQRILRIRDYCLEIQKTISRYGNDYQIFDSDGDYQRSIAFSILQIGELGRSLSEAYRKETCNRIQWGPIKGMRNMVAHSYGSMSREIIWETDTIDITVLLNFCEAQLKEKEFVSFPFRFSGYTTRKTKGKLFYVYCCHLQNERLLYGPDSGL